MLKIDLGTHDREIGELVTQHCTKFRAVLSARIHRTPPPFPLVEIKHAMKRTDWRLNSGDPFS